MRNNSSQGITYSIPGFSEETQTLAPGQEIEFSTSLIIGYAFQFDVVSAQVLIYTVTNQSGGLIFTNTTNGPGTLNGLNTSSTQNQEFIISNT